MDEPNATRLVRIGDGGSLKCGIYRCSCGNEREYYDQRVLDGQVKSCGCHHKRPTHGMVGTRTYGIWAQMIQRCTNPNKDDYKDYGRRGIRVCERWLAFENFYADMGAVPPNMTLGRKDNDGHYEPGNCEWQTRKQQMRNTRSTLNLTYNGKTQCVADWAAELGCKPNTLIIRLRRGWPVERVLGEVVEDQNQYLTLNGRTMNITDWANEVGISQQALKRRIADWGLERALTTIGRTVKSGPNRYRNGERMNNAPSLSPPG